MLWEIFLLALSPKNSSNQTLNWYVVFVITHMNLIGFTSKIAESKQNRLYRRKDDRVLYGQWEHSLLPELGLRKESLYKSHRC